MSFKVRLKVSLVLALGMSWRGWVGVAPALAQSSPLEMMGHTTIQEAEGQGVLPFTDVPSDHWAYQALLNLAGVYGCISGYPDGTFRGESPVNRYEFAAGLDACLSVLTGLIQQRQQSREIGSLIEAMEQSLQELREIDQSLPQTP